MTCNDVIGALEPLMATYQSLVATVCDEKIDVGCLPSEKVVGSETTEGPLPVDTEGPLAVDTDSVYSTYLEQAITVPRPINDGTTMLRRYQKIGADCHVNSLGIAAELLGIPLSRGLYDFLTTKWHHPSFTNLVVYFREAGRNGPFDIHHERWGVCRNHFEHILGQNQGIYVLLYGDHAITIDAKSKLVYDTDPRNPLPMSATDVRTHAAIRYIPTQFRNMYTVQRRVRYEPEQWTVENRTWHTIHQRATIQRANNARYHEKKENMKKAIKRGSYDHPPTDRNVRQRV